VSHDAGYAPFLDEVLREENRHRITILEGFPTVRELQATKVNILNLSQDLFRSDKLVDRTAAAFAHPIAPPPGLVVTSTPAASLSYATITSSASPPPLMSLPLGKITGNASSVRGQTRSVPAQPSWSPGPRGFDTLATPTQAAVESIKKRKDSNKLCNNHYLRGPCSKGDLCCFEHHYRPTSEEINAIAFLARQNPCTNGQDCDVEDCIYGHHVSHPGRPKETGRGEH
jgi:hypothetical protein